MSYNPEALPRNRRQTTPSADRVSAWCGSCGVRFIPGRGRPIPTACPTCGRDYWFSDTELAAIKRHNHEASQ